MTTYSKLTTDDINAPDDYFVRIDMGKEEEKKTGYRYTYYKSPTKLAKIMNCSRVKVTNFVDGRRTVPFSEYMDFNSSPAI